jgi:tetratricopeptide (TPR) repeat protein
VAKVAQPNVFFMRLVPKLRLGTRQNLSFTLASVSAFSVRFFLPVKLLAFLVAFTCSAMAAANEETLLQVLIEKIEQESLRGHFQDALRLADDALRQYPEGPALLFYDRGLIHVHLKHDNLAIRDFTEAIRLAPAWAVLYVDRGLAYARLGEQAKAMADYNRAVAIDPTNVRAYRDRGDLEDDLQFDTQAIRDYTVALQFAPEQIDVRSNRARIYFRRGQYREALRDYEQCLRVDPGNVEAAFNRAGCYANLGDLPRALREYSSIIRSHSQYLPAYADRAHIYFKQGNVTLALADARKALTLTPGDDYEYHRRGSLFLAFNDYVSALRDYRAALERDPASPFFLNSVAWLLATAPDPAARDGEEAITLARRANELSGWRDPSLIDTLAAAYAENGDYTRAVEYQTQACRMKSAGSGKVRESYQAHMELYRQKKPVRSQRTPFKM